MIRFFANQISIIYYIIVILGLQFTSACDNEKGNSEMTSAGDSTCYVYCFFTIVQNYVIYVYYVIGSTRLTFPR